MKILLIQPCSDSQRWKGQKSHFNWPPLGLAHVAALTPKEHEVTLTDEAVEAVNFDSLVDLIGIGIMTANSTRGYEIAREFRKRGKTVVIGGIHASMLPDEAAQHSDSVVIGEAESSWRQLLEDFSSARLKDRYASKEHPDLWNIPAPRRDLFQREAYKIPSTIMATRGCPHGCSFCSTSRYFGRKYRKRNPELVASEIASLQDRLFVFVDDNPFFDEDYSLYLLKLITTLKKRWVCQATLRVAENPDLLATMKKAGCIGVLIGVESIDQENLSSVGKGINNVAEYKEKIAIIRRAGIFVQGSFVFGFDNDDARTFDSVLDFVFATRLEAANFCVLTPLPGTTVFEALERENRLLHKDWSKYDRLNVVFTPRNMSPQELQRGVIRCYLTTYSYPGILKRMPWFSRQLLLHLGFNLAYRRGSYGQWKR